MSWFDSDPQCFCENPYGFIDTLGEQCRKQGYGLTQNVGDWRYHRGINMDLIEVLHEWVKDRWSYFWGTMLCGWSNPRGEILDHKAMERTILEAILRAKDIDLQVRVEIALQVLDYPSNDRQVKQCARALIECYLPELLPVLAMRDEAAPEPARGLSAELEKLQAQIIAGVRLPSEMLKWEPRFQPDPSPPRNPFTDALYGFPLPRLYRG